MYTGIAETEKTYMTITVKGSYVLQGYILFFHLIHKGQEGLSDRIAFQNRPLERVSLFFPASDVA